MRTPTKIGLALTLIWIVAFVVLVVVDHDAFAELKLNEWGDFLGGFSAPLALLWLVVGYFQQGEELRLNTEALKTQQQELERQVEETALLAQASMRQAAASETLTLLTKSDQDRELSRAMQSAQPLFVSKGGTSGTESHADIANEGASVRDVQVENSNGFSVTASPTTFLASGGTMRLSYGAGSKIVCPFTIVVRYTDALGEQRSKTLKFESPTKFRETTSEPA